MKDGILKVYSNGWRKEHWTMQMEEIWDIDAMKLEEIWDIEAV
jgi:hypothetical protein